MFDKAISIDSEYRNKFMHLRQPIQPDRYPKKFYIFTRYIDILMCGALVGFKYNRKKGEGAPAPGSGDEESERSIDATIPIKTVLDERERLLNIYRMIMLNEDDRKLSVEERIDNAFRYTDDNDERVAENIELMMSYAYGGVDILYEKFGSISTQEDAVDIMNRIYDGLKIEDKNSITIDQ
ncbi:MAG: hypothetical protein ACOX1N_05810 [Candidatus Methanomethylophilaceae archaeon]|jgi:hypothetical protein